MRPLLLLISTFVSLATADGLADLNSLGASSSAAASNISALSNSTAPGDISANVAQSKLDQVTTQISETQQRVVTAQTSWIDGHSAADFDGPYISFCSTVRGLAAALTHLGSSASQQGQAIPSAPMVNSIDACGDAVHDLGNYLRARNIITRSSWLQTIRAMGALTDATAAWNSAAKDANGTTAAAMTSAQA